MIRRLYVDNFRSLVDFTWEPGKETLVLGYNGSGKTSALDIVRILQEVCADNRTVGLSMLAEERTAWLNRPLMKVELDVEIAGRLYGYSLHLGFGSDLEDTSVAYESLNMDGQQVFFREGQEARIAPWGKDNGTHFPISSSLTVVSVVGGAFGGEPIIPLREYLSGILYLKPSPTFLFARKRGKAVNLDPSLANLIPWYVNLSNQPKVVDALTESLKNVWPELIGVEVLEYSPDMYNLILRVQGGTLVDGRGAVPFGTLSDGERLLVGLYMIAAYQKTHSPTTIIIDEPDNYVSLLEIQPWLLTLLDERPDNGQLILVSHNPEIIQTMGRRRVAYFSREDHLSPTKVSPLPPDETGLPLPELLARGWIDA